MSSPPQAVLATVQVERWRLVTDMELPLGCDYERFISGLLAAPASGGS